MSDLPIRLNRKLRSILIQGTMKARTTKDKFAVFSKFRPGLLAPEVSAQNDFSRHRHRILNLAQPLP